jgi:hypothetical protein
VSYNPQAAPTPAAPPTGTFPCPRCGAPVRQGATVCPNCHTPFYAAPPQQPYPGQPAYGTPYPAYPPAYGMPPPAFAPNRKAMRTKAMQETVGGAALLAIGLLLVVVSLTSSGRSYILFTPLIFGFIYLVKGLIGLGSLPKQ